MNLYRGNSSAWLTQKSTAGESGQSPVTRRILFAAFVVVGLAFAALVARLWFMQLLQGDHYRKLSENNRIRLVDIPPSRGLILDTKNRLLADNRPAFTLAVVPEDVPDWKALAKRLKELVGISQEDIDKARKAARGLPPFKPIRLRSHLNRHQLAVLETFRYELAGVKVLVEYRRAYLAARETAHLVGYLGEINKRELSRYPKSLYRLGDYVGRYGLEAAHERLLHGKRGARQVEVDAMGRELTLLDKVEAKSGLNLVLTIDLDMQRAAAKALQNKVGAVVAMNPNNGQIYCLYSSPTFDQNNFIWGMTSKQWKSLSNDKKHPLKNRAISGNYPPGSTYKIITAAAGLEEGIITPETTFFCSGQIPFGRRYYKCWAYKKGGHGSTNLHKALAQSCDVYFYRVGQKLGVNRLAKYARAFGLGKSTNIKLPHEAAGLVPDTAWKKRRFGEIWHDGETLSTAIGQGFNLTTPLQLARMVSVVANRGRLVTPTLVKQLVPGNEKDPVPAPKGVSTKVPVSQKTLDLIHDGLVGTVNDLRGTAKKVRMPGITVAGKTGTAQVVGLKFEKSFGKEHKVPWKYRSHALFVCYAPAENPKIAVAVIVEHGGHGGSDAAPVARKVMEVFFGLNKDKKENKKPIKKEEVSGD